MYVSHSPLLIRDYIVGASKDFGQSLEHVAEATTHTPTTQQLQMGTKWVQNLMISKLNNKNKEIANIRIASDY